MVDSSHDDGMVVAGVGLPFDSAAGGEDEGWYELFFPSLVCGLYLQGLPLINTHKNSYKFTKTYHRHDSAYKETNHAVVQNFPVHQGGFIRESFFSSEYDKTFMKFLMSSRQGTKEGDNESTQNRRCLCMSRDGADLEELYHSLYSHDSRINHPMLIHSVLCFPSLSIYL